MSGPINLKLTVIRGTTVILECIVTQDGWSDTIWSVFSCVPMEDRKTYRMCEVDISVYEVLRNYFRVWGDLNRSLDSQTRKRYDKSISEFLNV